MLAFKVLRGSHSEGRGSSRKLYSRGDVIQTERELDKQFGREKFERLETTTVAVKESPAPAKDDEDEFGLNRMTKKELLEFARSEEIDIPADAMRKDEILNCIKAVLEEA